MPRLLPVCGVKRLYDYGNHAFAPAAAWLEPEAAALLKP
jgi:hypothetical protein